MSETAFHLSSMGASRGDRSAEAAETTPGGSEPARWVVVWQGPGLLPAQIVADRLQSEGIPANAWQEGAGRAIGLTIGLLGTGYVSVPSSFEEPARDLLAQSPDLDDDDAPPPTDEDTEGEAL